MGNTARCSTPSRRLLLGWNSSSESRKSGHPACVTPNQEVGDGGVQMFLLMREARAQRGNGLGDLVHQFGGALAVFVCD